MTVTKVDAHFVVNKIPMTNDYYFFKQGYDVARNHLYWWFPKKNNFMHCVTGLYERKFWHDKIFWPHDK